MSQIIQLLQNGTDKNKGLLIRQVSDKLKAKTANSEALSPLEIDLQDLINFDTLPEDKRSELKKRLSKINLLSPGIVNPKTAKDAGLSNLSNWILHLSPSDLSGFNVCPMASQGCRKACLNGAGRGLFDGVQLPRLRKTLYFVKMRQDFLSHIDKEISKIEIKDKKKRIIIRLNGTSDISWETFKVRDNMNIFELHSKVQFYDYTKVFTRLARVKNIANYHITFSWSETNDLEAVEALKLGVNVATVFKNKELPKKYMGFSVIDGDAHDLRFLDKGNGVIVGLYAKGAAKRDESGFVKTG